MANFLVAGIKDQVREAAQGTIPPQLEFHVELGGASTYLGGTDLMAAEFLDDFGDFAGGDALDIHFGHGENEGLLTAHAFFQGRGIEVDPVAHLRHGELDRPDASGERFRLEAIGVAKSLLASLVGLGLENSRTFVAHGLVKEKAQPFRET